MKFSLFLSFITLCIQSVAVTPDFWVAHFQFLFILSRNQHQYKDARSRLHSFNFIGADSSVERIFNLEIR